MLRGYKGYNLTTGSYGIVDGEVVEGGDMTANIAPLQGFIVEKKR